MKTAIHQTMTTNQQNFTQSTTVQVVFVESIKTAIIQGTTVKESILTAMNQTMTIHMHCITQFRRIMGLRVESIKTAVNQSIRTEYITVAMFLRFGHYASNCIISLW